jgi:hypothetical protein
MPRLQRNFLSLLLERRPRLATAGARPNASPMIGIGELVGPTRPGRQEKGTSLLSQFFAAEMRAWRGQQPLWLTFWIYGVAVSAAIALLYGAAIYTAASVVQQALLIALGVYTGWVLTSLWRCTEASKHFSGLIARFLIVPWAANVALVLAFIQIGLFPQLLGFP